MVCSDIAVRIPWVAGGGASAEEKALVFLHVASCDTCRKDLAAALALALRVRGAVGALPAAGPRSWRRLAAVLDDIEERPTAGLLRRLEIVLEAAGAPAVLPGLLDWTAALLEI